MRNTYTNKPTGKRRTHLFAGFFGIFSSSKNKILLDAQIKEYNTKLSTRIEYKTIHSVLSNLCSF